MTYDFSQILFRNQHGGVQWDKVKLTGEKSVNHRLRSSQDKRLFDAMTSEQEAAYCAVNAAFMLLTNGLGARIANYGHVTGGTGNLEYGAELIARYKDWHSICRRRKLNANMALKIIVDGLSCSQSDKQHHIRNGMSKVNLLGCLNLW